MLLLLCFLQVEGSIEAASGGGEVERWKGEVGQGLYWWGLDPESLIKMTSVVGNAYMFLLGTDWKEKMECPLYIGNTMSHPIVSCKCLTSMGNEMDPCCTSYYHGYTSSLSSSISVLPLQNDIHLFDIRKLSQKM